MILSFESPAGLDDTIDFLTLRFLYCTTRRLEIWVIGDNRGIVKGKKKKEGMGGICFALHLHGVIPAGLRGDRWKRGHGRGRRFLVAPYRKNGRSQGSLVMTSATEAFTLACIYLYLRPKNHAMHQGGPSFWNAASGVHAFLCWFPLLALWRSERAAKSS